MFNNIENFALPLIALLALIMPTAYIKRKFDIFEPIYFFAVAFVLGGFFRSICLFNDPSFRAAFKLTEGEVKITLIYTILGFLFFQVGYNCLFPKVIAKRCFISFPENWDRRRFALSMVFVLVTGFIFLFYFLFKSGGMPDNIYEISYKRRVSNNYICLGAKLLSIGYVLYLIHMYKNNRFTIQSRIKLFLLLICASILPFVSSQRLGILTLLFLFYIYSSYFKGKLRLKKTLILLLIASFFLLIMVELRQARRTKSIRPLEVMQLDRAASFFIKSHYFFDITTSALITKHTPSTINYQNGKTLLNWVVFPIPRSIWPEKPFNLGKTVSDKIYYEKLGIKCGGVTPPFLFELYLNFKIIGIVVGMFLFGILSKAAYLSLIYNKNFVTLAFHALNLRFVYGLFIRDLTWNLVTYLQWVLPLFLILFFITHGRGNVSAKLKK